MAFSGGLAAVNDQWLIQYDKCDRLIKEVWGRIEERDKEARNGKISSQANSAIRRQIKQLETDLNELKQNLIRSAASSQITSLEGERRQTMLDNLVSKEAQLESAFSGKTTSRAPERTLLGDDFSWNKTPASVMENQDDSLEDFSVDDIRKQQKRVIEQQDQGLEALSSVIARQKQLAYAIGDETDLQNEIIDDITDHVDRTRERLIRETRHVEIVSRKSNTCWFWVVIIFLLVAIIVIVAVPYK